MDHKSRKKITRISLFIGLICEFIYVCITGKIIIGIFGGLIVWFIIDKAIYYISTTKEERRIWEGNIKKERIERYHTMLEDQEDQYSDEEENDDYEEIDMDNQYYASNHEDESNPWNP